MKLPPAVIVHGLDQAQAVLSLGRPVTLLSAPWAGVYAGVGWWRALLAQAGAGSGAESAPDVLDCGDAPGRALAALRAGQRRLVLRAPAAVLADIAGRGAMVLAAPPPALDLATPGVLRRLADWLAET
jgi:hypothetical protein